MKKKIKPKRKKTGKEIERFRLSKEEKDALLRAASGPRDEALADYHAAGNDSD